MPGVCKECAGCVNLVGGSVPHQARNSFGSIYKSISVYAVKVGNTPDTSNLVVRITIPGTLDFGSLQESDPGNLSKYLRISKLDLRYPLQPFFVMIKIQLLFLMPGSIFHSPQSHIQGHHDHKSCYKSQ